MKENSAIPEINIGTYAVKDTPGVFCMPLAGLFESYSHFLISPHRVNYYGLLIIENGSGRIWTGPEAYLIKPPQLITVPRGEIEAFHCKDLRGYALFFSGDFIYKNPNDIEWLNNLKLFDQPNAEYLPQQQLEEFKMLLGKIEYEINKEADSVRDEILIILVKTVLLLSERMKCSGGNGKAAGRILYIREFKNLLEENYRFAKSVQQYADMLSITPKKLNQVINTSCGRAAKQVIEERILLEIKRLLIHTNQSIKEISNYLGFNDQANFNKFFKKYTGTTPVEYRKTAGSFIQ